MTPPEPVPVTYSVSLEKTLTARRLAGGADKLDVDISDLDAYSQLDSSQSNGLGYFSGYYFMGNGTSLTPYFYDPGDGKIYLRIVAMPQSNTRTDVLLQYNAGNDWDWVDSSVTTQLSDNDLNAAMANCFNGAVASMTLNEILSLFGTNGYVVK